MYHRQMALTATLHNVRIELNDADRGVYESLELRVAQHPSETVAYMLSRIFAYCLLWEPDIAFSKGLSTTDEPAVWVKTLDGRVKSWIEVGHPSAERLHKASKAAQHVAVCTTEDPAAYQRALAGERIHRAKEIDLIGLPGTLLAELQAQVVRRMAWEVAATGGQLYVTTAGQTYSGEVTRTTLVAS